MSLKTIFYPVVGGFLGYLYYKKVGCASGTCPITSNPYMSIFYGVLMGMLMT